MSPAPTYETPVPTQVTPVPIQVIPLSIHVTPAPIHEKPVSVYETLLPCQDACPVAKGLPSPGDRYQPQKKQVLEPNRDSLEVKVTDHLYQLLISSPYQWEVSQIQSWLGVTTNILFG